MKQLRKLYVDFETYFNTETGYSLREISMTEYIRSEQFKTLGCGYLYEGEYGWVRGEDMDEFKSLDWENIEMIAHNIKFDGAIFAWRYGIRPARYFDTQSLSRAILGQNLSSHSLKAVSAYLGLPPKGELMSDGLLTLSASQEHDMMVYNQRDLECCSLIDEKLRSQFPESQFKALDWTIRSFINPVLTLNVDLLQKMVEREQIRKAGIFEKLGIEKTVFSSNKKFAELLEERKIEVPTKPSPRDPSKQIPAFSLSDPGFAALKKVCPDLYEARVAAKSTITETRGANLAEIGRSGPFPFDVQFSGAIGTHRFSGGSGAGGNPQNFPNKGDIRKAVTVSSGNRLVVGDFSAIEARLVSWLAKEPILMSIFNENGDPYSAFASTIYGHEVNKKDHPTERKIGKTCILGLGYNMGAEKFQFTLRRDTGIEMPIEWCYKTVNLYRDTYPNIPALWESATQLLPQMQEGYTNYVPFAPFLRIEKNAIVLPSGLRIQYPNLRKQEVEYQIKSGEWKIREEWIYDVYKRKYDAEPVKLYGGKIIENICQALAGEICKIAIERAEELGLQVVGQVHDEILVVSKQVEEQAHRQALQIAMEQPISWWPELRLGAEVKSAQNWAEAKG